MKILYITQYFHPEIGATTNRALSNVRCFAEKGHDVTVLTEMPNHPKGIIFDGYEHKIFMKEKMEDFMIHRVWVYTNKKKNFIIRLLFYISFMFLGTIHTILKWKKYDIIYITSPPLFVAYIGIGLKKIFKKIKIIFEVRDLWPDTAVELGELNNRIVIQMSLNLEKKIYRISDKIIAISKDMKEKIISKGFEPEKIRIIHNGTDPKFLFRTKTISEDIIKEYKQEGRFIVIYAGIIGLAQSLETIIKAADRLRNENILFMFIGSGPNELKFKQLVKNMKLSNVLFIGEIPRDKVHEYLFLADCGVIPLRKLELFKGALPSKIFDYMGCDLPILLGIKGEAKDLIERSGAGIYFEPENYNELADKILIFKNNPIILKNMSSKGRDFVLENFNREKQAEILERELLEIMDKS